MSGSTDPGRGAASAAARAIELLLSMGSERAGHDPAGAADCFREAAELARAGGDGAAEARGLRELGSLEMARGEHEAASVTISRALDLARAADDDPAIATCLNALGLLSMREGAVEDALAWLRESLGRTTEAAHDPAVARVRAETLETLGLVYRETGDPRQAFLVYQEALEIRRAAGDEPGLASCHNHLGNLYYRTGKFSEAVTHYGIALETRRAAGDRRGTASTTNNLAGALLLQGKLRESAGYFEESRVIAEELGDARQLASILSNQGLLRSYEGRVDEAEQLHRESLRIHRERDDPAGQAHALNNLSTLAFERGRPDEAIALADECIALWERAGRRGNVAKAWENRGRALLEIGRIAEAREAADAALDAATQAQSDEYRAEACVLRARVLAASGLAEEAMAAAHEATEAAERSGSPPLRAMSATVLGGLHVEAGRLEDAKQELERASRLVRGLPHPWDRACILAEQGRLLVLAGASEGGAERLRRALHEFEVLSNARGQLRTLADLAAAVAATDPREAGMLRTRAEALAREHDLGDVLTASQRRADKGSSPGAAGGSIPADRLTELATELLEIAASRSEDPVDFIDPLFRFLRERHGVERAALTLAGERIARAAAAAPDGRFAKLLRDPSGSTEQARFVLVAGGEPTGSESGRMEVNMGSFGTTSARLVLGRNVPFGEDETISIEAVARVASLALVSPLERLDRRGVARAEDIEVFEGLVGGSHEMREVYRLIDQVAPSDSSVLLLGESGTGKELAARAVHARSDRRTGPFVVINCPSIPRELIEAELFGHEKGAFTGATATRPGKVELANGGTLFLDEVGDMALATQVRLLRFLEEREFQRVGGRETHSVDVRILAATSRDLAEAVENGDFRGDLFYRLNVVPVRMPPLRERPEDLGALCAHLLVRLARGDAEPPVLSGRALDRIAAWNWPGNVRELRNTLEYMVTVAGGELLDEAHLPDAIRRGSGRPQHPAERDPHGGVAAGAQGLRPGETMEARLRDVEAALIRGTLEATDWNQSAAARRLGVTETKVRNRMRQYGIRRPDEPGGNP